MTTSSSDAGVLINSRSLSLLEFDLVREQLASYTTFESARELARALLPSADGEDVTARQQETSDARRFLEERGNFDLSGAYDLSPLIQRAALGGSLRGAELRQVADTLGVAHMARQSFSRQRHLARLHPLSQLIPEMPSLERELDIAISPSGDILDGASSSLRGLRVDSRQAYQRLDDLLQRTLRRLQRQGILQEPLVTERNGRMVLLIKSEMRHRLAGIVHDVSDSGATVFVEPLTAVSLGNQWRELRLAVEREEERVLHALSEYVAASADDLSLMVELLARLDLAMAKGRHSLAMGATPPHIETAGRPRVMLDEARHPLLSGPVVPISAQVGDEHPVLLITGPNAGGKTVALKTVGLAVLMAQAGLHLPVREASLSLFDDVFADIGDQQSIQQSLSTFSSHIRTLRTFMEQATSRSLVLLDELGTSTDPEEGTALAKAVLDHFAKHGVTLIATSHYRGVAAFVQEHEQMRNASVELAPTTLEPTYQLSLGLPGRSYALAIAARHGLDASVVEQARSMLGPTQQGAERLLQELHQERQMASEMRREAADLQTQAREKQVALDHQLQELEEKRAELVEEARLRLRDRAEAVELQLQRAEQALSRPRRSAPIQAPPPGTYQFAPAETPKDGTPEHTPRVEDAEAEVLLTVQEALQRVAQVQQDLVTPQWQTRPVERGDWLGRLRAGDRVYLRGIPQPVEVITPSDGETLEVLLGAMRARLPVHRVERPASGAPSAPERLFMSPGPRPQPNRTLDLRGRRVEDALSEVDLFLDQAARAGAPDLRIIHGVGTGALRSAVRNHLARHPMVNSFRPEEGPSDGVTMIEVG